MVRENFQRLQSKETHPPTPTIAAEAPVVVLDPQSHPEHDEPSVLVSTPVRPKKLAEISLPGLRIPSITQLRDFPNLTAPISSEAGSSSARIALPSSAPTSPRRTPTSILSGEPYTPASSPGIGVSVILANPTFLPLPPHTTPKASTPTEDLLNSPVVGSWDNFLDQPTYQANGDAFWRSREKIPLVSTEVSDLEISGISSISIHSMEGQMPTGIMQQQKNPVLQDQALQDQIRRKSNAEATIRELEEKLSDSCDDLDPDLITEFTAPHMHARLAQIGSHRDAYRSAIRRFLETFKQMLTQPEINQWQQDMKKILGEVRNHEAQVLTKITQASSKPAQMSEFEKAALKFKRSSLRSRRA